VEGETGGREGEEGEGGRERVRERERERCWVRWRGGGV
jgi:hypothetical protein